MTSWLTKGNIFSNIFIQRYDWDVKYSCHSLHPLRSYGSDPVHINQHVQCKGSWSPEVFLWSDVTVEQSKFIISMFVSCYKNRNSPLSLIGPVIQASFLCTFVKENPKWPKLLKDKMQFRKYVNVLETNMHAAQFQKRGQNMTVLQLVGC